MQLLTHTKRRANFKFAIAAAGAVPRWQAVNQQRTSSGTREERVCQNRPAAIVVFPCTSWGFCAISCCVSFSHGPSSRRKLQTKVNASSSRSNSSSQGSCWRRTSAGAECQCHILCQKCTQNFGPGIQTLDPVAEYLQRESTGTRFLSCQWTLCINRLYKILNPRT